MKQAMSDRKLLGKINSPRKGTMFFLPAVDACKLWRLPQQQLDCNSAWEKPIVQDLVEKGWKNPGFLGTLVSHWANFGSTTLQTSYVS